MTCPFQGCTNNKFASHKECALHCVKSNYQDDKLKGVLAEFYNLLRIYIADFMNSAPAPTSRSIHSLLNSSASSYKRDLGIDISQKVRDYKFIDEENRNLIRRANTHDLIILSNIHFPYRDNQDNFDYFKLLELFSEIHLLDCHLYIGNWRLEDVIFFFQGCIFYNWFDITPIRMLSNDTNCLFSECEFKTKVKVSSTEISNIYENNIFSGCSFGEILTVDNVVLKKEFTGFVDKSQINTFSIEILKCIFEDKCKLNSMKIINLKIDDTEFRSKLEIKETTVQVLIFNNSNVNKIFDSFKSKFVKARFSKSIFNEFAGFEEVQFGLLDKFDDNNFKTVFEHVTFMDFSSFRGSSFESGLNFSKTNLKDKPNFLNVKVNPSNTKRETFRIIKNSFDDVGNKLEANKFFAKEMMAYSIELDDIKSKEVEHIRKVKEDDEGGKVKRYKKAKGYKDSRRARWVFNANNFISEFGENYLRPIFILIVSVIVYTVITLCHKWYFDSHDYFMSWKWFDTISSFFNEFAINILPFRIFIKDRNGIEFISLFFYIWFAVLIWQIIVSVKRHTQR